MRGSQPQSCQIIGLGTIATAIIPSKMTKVSATHYMLMVGLIADAGRWIRALWINSSLLAVRCAPYITAYLINIARHVVQAQFVRFQKSHFVFRIP